MRSARGQATVDYVALIALVAILVAAAVAVAAQGAPGIVNAVVGQIRHALCVVVGGSCPVSRPRPCTMASTRDQRHYALTLLLVRVDHDTYVLRERMSDGTVRLTLARSDGAGVEAGVGATATVSAGGRPIGVSNEARAGAQGVITRGRVFVARDAREASAILRALRAGRRPPAPHREEFVEGGVRGLAELGLGSSIAGVSLEGLGGTVAGARRDRRTGDVTLTLGSVGGGWGALNVAFGGPLGIGDRAATLGLTLDRRRRPVELTLSAAVTGGVGARLAPRLGRALAKARAARGSAVGRRFELAARLDLRDPIVAAAWRRFRRAPASSGAIRALGAAIRDRAQLDIRSYGTDSSAGGAEVGVSAGLRLGGEVEHATERSRLLAASSRPPGGLWEPRIDCLPA